MIVLTSIIQSALCQMQHKTWQGNLYSASLIAPNIIIVCRWWINDQWKCLHSFLIADLLPTEDLHKVLAVLYLLFQVSCMSTRTQLSKLINVLNMWRILELQPTMQQILPGTLVAVYQCIRQAGLKLTME